MRPPAACPSSATVTQVGRALAPPPRRITVVAWGWKRGGGGRDEHVYAACVCG
jgi:hypothetical protein